MKYSLDHFTKSEVHCQSNGDRTPHHVIALRREQRRRLAAIPRYDRYIAEAAGDLTLQAFWRNLKRQELEDAQRINARLGREALRCPTYGGASASDRRLAISDELRHA